MKIHIDNVVPELTVCNITRLVANTSERMTQKLDGILDYTYPKARHDGLMRKRLRRASLCYYLWRSAKSGAMGCPLSVGLQGPPNSAFRCDITQRTNATRSVDAHNYLIRWRAHRLECGGIRNWLLHTLTAAHPHQQRQLFLLVGYASCH